VFPLRGVNRARRILLERTGRWVAACPGCRSFRSVTGALTAVDVNGLPGDEGGVFQKQDRIHDIPNFTHPSHRMQAGEELVSFGSVHWRLDHAGRNGVDPM
jgi:hypothetical protein